MSRDDFSEQTKRVLAHRSGHRCAKPDFLAPTSGPASEPNHWINLGFAAHITAASPGGPRFDPTLSPAARKSVSNGLWMCPTHGKLVDSDESAFDVAILRQWKALAETNASALLGRSIVEADATQAGLSQEEVEILIAAAVSGELIVFSSAQEGESLRAGAREFADSSDRAVAAIYLEALQVLVRRGLARWVAGIRYTLTGTGFKIARRLVADLGQGHVRGV